MCFRSKAIKNKPLLKVESAPWIALCKRCTSCTSVVMVGVAETDDRGDCRCWIMLLETFIPLVLLIQKCITAEVLDAFTHKELS